MLADGGSTVLFAAKGQPRCLRAKQSLANPSHLCDLAVAKAKLKNSSEIPYGDPKGLSLNFAP
jgi:hypothetical protein